MADIRINSLPSTATSFNTDDYIAIDGASGGTRKMLAATLPLTDVTLGGTSGPSVKSTLSARAPRQGLVFDGSAGATVANVPAFGTSDYSFAVWFFHKATSVVAQDLFDSGPNGCLFCIASDSRVLLYDRKAGATRAASSTSLTVGKSYFLAYSRTGQIYINGVADGAVVADGSNYTDAVAFVGKSYANTEFCFGSISGALIYNRALSASEVVALYEAGAPNPADIGYVSGISPAAWAPGFSSPAVTSSSGSSVTATGQYGASFSTLLGTVGAVPVTVVIDVTASNITSAKAYFANSAADSSGVAVSSVITLNQGRNVINLKRSSSATTYLCVEIAGGVTTWTFTGTNITVGRGLLLAPDAAQAGGGLTWYDTSGNAANISWTSGVSWNVPSSRVLGGNWTTSGNLTVSGTGGFGNTVSITKAGGAILELNDSNQTARIRTVETGATHDLAFWAESAEKMRLKGANGNLLIGTTTDGGQKLQVAGDLALSGTGAGFTINATSGNSLNIIQRSVNTAAGAIQFKTSSTADWIIGVRETSDSDFHLFSYGTVADALTIARSTGNATFAGDVYIASGKVLKGNGNLYLDSVSSNVIIRPAGSQMVSIDSALTTLSNKLCISNAVTPASASDTGTTGTIVWDASYIYVCTATNTWKRVAIATWP